MNVDFAWGASTLLKLDDKDLRLLLSAVTALNADLDPVRLSGRALSLLAAIVPSDCSSFDFFASDNSYDSTAWTNRPDISTPENMSVFAEHVHEHRLIPIALARRDGVAMKMTDVVLQREFERSGLFNEFYRKHGLSRQMGLALPVAADLTVSCVATRGGKDFSERERVMMTLAAPHLLNAMRNAIAYERVAGALVSGGSGVAAFDSDGRLVFANELVWGLLNSYFPDDRVDADGLPETVSRWVAEQCSVAAGELTRPHSPLLVDGKLGVLRIRLMVNALSRERNLIFEETRFPQFEGAFEGLHLTRREREILFWITKGKTNSVIGEICGISLRTVQKHVEHIYQKLGVETRTAAIVRGLEVMSHA